MKISPIQPVAVASLVCSLFCAFQAPAALLQNGSFESASGSPAVPDDWNPSGNLAVVSNQGATDGSQALALSWGNQPSNGQIWQSFATEADVTYRLRFDFGKFSVNQPTQVARLAVDVYGGTDFTGSDLLTELVQDGTNSDSGFYNTFQFEFTALGDTATLRFRDVSDAQGVGGGFDAMLDNVEVAVVPEPSASALVIVTGAFAFALCRRRMAGNSGAGSTRVG